MNRRKFFRWIAAAPVGIIPTAMAVANPPPHAAIVDRIQEICDETIREFANLRSGIYGPSGVRIFENPELSL